MVNKVGTDVNIEGLILAGPSDMKDKLHREGHLPSELEKKVLNTIDCSYVGMPGFSEAIELSSELLGSMKYIQEKKTLQRFFDMLKKNNDVDKICYGFKNTETALLNGAIETLILWEDLPHIRFECNKGDSVEIIYAKEKPKEIDVKSYEPMIDWLVKTAEENNVTMEFITDHTEEGEQYCQGFGGIGGIMHWAMNLEHFNDIDEIDEYDDFI